MIQNTVLGRRIIIFIIVFVQLASVSIFSTLSFSPLAAAACDPISGTVAPTGAGSHTYSYNEERCVWENAFYTWSPYTKQYAAKYDQTPVLNADGTAWEYPSWEFSAAKGAFVLRTISIPVPAADPEPQNAAGTETATTPSSPEGGATSRTTGGNAIDNSGHGSDNTLPNGFSTTADISLVNSTNIISVLDSVATTGNASVLQNTNGGDATTGNATAIANYMTMIQSGWNPTSGEITTFNADLFGSFTGDLLFDPDTILHTGQASNNSISHASNNDISVVVEENASITNTINLTAQTGDAKVSNNTNAGNATTGDAKAVANLINMINSDIASERGFIGNINIHGDFNGDFLLPPALLAQLHNTGYQSNNSVEYNNGLNADVSVSKNASITNNFDLGAQSGNAIVTNNTNGGNAMTGTASTNVTQQNYIGVNNTQQKGLLVFVNVMGNWVGFVNPMFATIGNTGMGSANATHASSSTNVLMDYSQDYSITNNLNLKARSGDAMVSNNTDAGNATSGNAFAGANVFNLIDSNLNYNDWFGVLFINVFGSWNGSFGSDTKSGGSQGPVLPPSNQKDNAAIIPEQAIFGTDSANSPQTVAATTRSPHSKTSSDIGAAVMGSSDGGGAHGIEGDQKYQISDNPGRALISGRWLFIGATLGAAFAIRKQEFNAIRGLLSRGH